MSELLDPSISIAGNAGPSERLKRREQEIKDRIEWAERRGFGAHADHQRFRLAGFQEAESLATTEPEEAGPNHDDDPFDGDDALIREWGPA